MHRCYGTGVCYLLNFQLRNGMQYPIPKVWQVVLPNVPVQCGIVHPDVHGLLYCSCHTVALHTFYFEVFHRCYVASVVLVFKYRWCCLQTFLISFSKCSRWLPYTLFFTVNLVTLEPVDHTVLTQLKIIQTLHNEVRKCGPQWITSMKLNKIQSWINE